MRKQKYILLIIWCFILFSCRESKPEIIQREPNYTIHNYKLDDDEIARRKIQDSIDVMNDSLTSKKTN